MLPTFDIGVRQANEYTSLPVGMGTMEGDFSDHWITLHERHALNDFLEGPQLELWTDRSMPRDATSVPVPAEVMTHIRQALRKHVCEEGIPPIVRHYAWLIEDPSSRMPLYTTETGTLHDNREPDTGTDITSEELDKECIDETLGHQQSGLAAGPVCLWDGCGYRLASDNAACIASHLSQASTALVCMDRVLPTASGGVAAMPGLS
ncbi:hypothetical protein WOLCODRAFT_19334 [Wolfiporia cocos MD-104 SS10]|uniref:Uncharacterized protein n=1 Tax=Wolfiporia cocos (strain MD-104) TaxID=742152 RepID=A0A2H3JSD0_WOLCO|nr:hypothetical protein WOLCODRAFT_19334 [Wolfiporia cocos MD-104 SS10]